MSASSLFSLVNGSYLFEGPNHFSISLAKGYWSVECWGGSGGSSYQGVLGLSFPGGHGGYSVGVLILPIKTQVHVFSGGQGSSNSTGSGQHISGGFNGGGFGFVGFSGHLVGSGGGSSDVRIGSCDLSDRVIVAGGGGGAGAGITSNPSGKFGGDGGGIDGLNGGGYSADYDDSSGKGGKQDSGGLRGYYNSQEYGSDGLFFYGGNGSTNSNTDSSAGGGGSGYYGGGGGAISGGGGGSGFIGGVHSLFGIESRTVSGNMTFFNPFGILERGHLGNGFVRITPLGFNRFNTCSQNSNRFSSVFLIFLILIVTQSP